MEFLSQMQSLRKYGQPAALDENEIYNLIKLAKPTKNDVFYDLGSGYGDVVRFFYAKTKARRAVGLEVDHKRFLISIERTRDEFGRKLKNLDFWCTTFQDYNFSDATIIYSSIDEISSEPKADDIQVNLFNDYFSKNKIKILKRDFPLVGYKSVDAIRDTKGSWFFLMETPLQNHKIKDKQEWFDHVFRRKGKTVTDLANHYRDQYRKRGLYYSKSVICEFRKNFERIANKRFGGVALNN